MRPAPSRFGYPRAVTRPTSTCSERIRCARAGSVALLHAGPGQDVVAGGEVRDFDGVPHVLERALPADFALIRAHQVDRYGNLVFRGAGRSSR